MEQGLSLVDPRYVSNFHYYIYHLGKGYTVVVLCSILVPYRVEEQAVSAPVATFLKTKLATILGIA